MTVSLALVDYIPVILFALTGILLMRDLYNKLSKGAFALVAAAVPQERGAMIFIAFMVLGYLGFCGSMTRIAARMKKKASVLLYVLSFVLLMGMGYLGSRQFGNDGRMNWIEEGINICAQTCLFSATFLLHKAGLAHRESL